MKCEEFEEFGLDAERDASLSEVQRVAAREHASTCSRCAALQDSWQAARVELHAFADATGAAETPARVEMRLRQEYRAQHGMVKTRRTFVIAAWALAAAAAIAMVVSWKSWHPANTGEIARHDVPAAVAGPVQKTDEKPAPQKAAAANPQTVKLERNARAVASRGAATSPAAENAFALLPGILPQEAEQSEMVRVRMRRGSLGALGLPVNEERAGDWIQVDLLVGDDGQPRAVRLHPAARRYGPG